MNNDETWYESIKKMTVEELAYFLLDYSHCGRCIRNGNNCFPYTDIDKTIEWLNSNRKAIK